MSWDVLEEQLFASKVGGDEKRREIFQTILRLKRDDVVNERLNVQSSVGSSNPLFGGDSMTSAGFHTDSWTLDKELSERRSSLLRRAWPTYRYRKNRSGRSLYWETVEIMRCVLDVGTHLSWFPTPLAPDNAIFIAARDDLYIPRKHVTDVRNIWPGQQ